jgi:hypothetical protein
MQELVREPKSGVICPMSCGSPEQGGIDALSKGETDNRHVPAAGIGLPSVHWPAEDHYAKPYVHTPVRWATGRRVYLGNDRTFFQ